MRLFIALDLPASVRAELAAWAAQAAPPEVRRVPAENLHVTLAFLGSRSGDEAAAARGLMPMLARPLGDLVTAGALWLPPRRPGVLSVSLVAEASLAALHEELVAALTEAIGFVPERRGFRPHVTVGRIARGVRIDTRRALDPPPPQLRVPARSLVLYRSRTAPEGARYEALSSVALS